MQVVRAENSTGYAIVQKAVLEYVNNHEIFGGEGIRLELKTVPGTSRKRRVKKASKAKSGSVFSGRSRKSLRDGGFVEESPKIYRIVSKERYEAMLRDHPALVLGTPECNEKIKAGEDAKTPEEFIDVYVKAGMDSKKLDYLKKSETQKQEGGE